MTQDPLWLTAKSNVAGADWPPVKRAAAAALEALARQCEQTEWLSPEDIAQGQFRQLRKLAQYAAAHSPHFARRLAQAGSQIADLVSVDALRKLPLLTRRELQAGGDVHCAEVPKDHLPLHETRTSGSTGEPVVVKRSALCQLFWNAATMREYFWNERDFSLRVSAIRALVPQREYPNWGIPASALFETGTSQTIPINTDIARQAALLAAFDPQILVVYPNVLAALLPFWRTAPLKLKLIRSIGETLPAELAAEARAVTGAKVVDNYSSQEAGIIALQCPGGDGYHVMAENLIVEVLDGSGQPCKPGEVGRVVLTDLHNFATPLIRYDIGDYAEAGGVCACGRGLPVLKRIIGRERNLILMPDGTKHWPLVGFAQFRDIAPIRQYQFVQHTRDCIEIRLVADGELTPVQEDRLRAVIQDALGHPFALVFSYFDSAIPRGANGKFDEFVCLAT